MTYLLVFYLLGLSFCGGCVFEGRYVPDLAEIICIMIWPISVPLIRIIKVIRRRKYKKIDWNK